jgi:glucose-6-phosphate isomerase
MSGLPITLENQRIVFGKDMAHIEPSVRTIEELRPFLLEADADFAKPIAYYMYRNVGLRDNVNIFNEKHLRYDVTVIENGKIGREFVKTIGHYHPIKPGTESRYPEIYQVILGSAFIVMQKIGKNENRIESVYVVAASSGEVVVMPPGCGHVTVNIGETSLVLANIVSNDFASVYDPYRVKRGASYYVLEHDGVPYLQSNELYGSVPKPLMLKPKREFLGISEETPLYTFASRDFGKFRWLNFPEAFEQELKIEKLFRVH